MKEKHSNITSTNSSVYLTLLLLILFPAMVLGQEMTVTGTIIGAEDNLPLPGVNVIIEGTNTGVQSNFDGQYSIQAIKGDKLVFSFVGMQNQTIEVTKEQIDVVMETEKNSLDEVVVIGYGTVKKKELTGAVSRVEAEDIDQFVTSDLASTLQGQMAGVSVSSSSGEPGEPADIQIRGITSLSGSNTPLFVVNGIPQIDNPQLSPNEIETIDVLKDAASTAVYGARGAAGVILITTKQGKAGKMNINFDYSYGIQRIGEGTPLMKTRDQIYYETIIYNYAGGFNPGPSNSEWLNNDNKFDDYVLVENAATTSYELNVSGGTDKFTYSVVGGYFDQDGILLNSNFKRYNGRASTTYDNNNWHIDGSVAFAIENNRQSSGGLILQASRYKPYFPFLDADSDVAFTDGSGGTDTPLNNLGQALKQKDDRTRDRINANLNIRYNITKDLDVTTRVGTAIINDMRNVFKPKFTLINVEDGTNETDPTKSGVDASSSRRTKFSWDASLNYNMKFGQHRIRALATIALEEEGAESFNASIEGVTNNNIPFLNGGSVNENVSSGFNYTKKTVGTLGRLQYNYKGKYLVSALARYDGSSRFGRDYRWGLFPSVSAAWNVSDETFWEPINKTINNFKIRLSHGTVGNDSFDDYEFASTIAQQADYIFDEDDNSVSVGSAIRSYANRNVKWETSISSNIGIDLSFLKNKINLTADYYYTRKEDMLFPVRLPGSAGAYYDPTLTLNIGNMVNSGLEIGTNYRANIGKSKLSLNATFTKNNNEITKITEGNTLIFNSSSDLIRGDNSSIVTVLAEGYEAASYFLYETNGTVQTQEQLAAYRQFPSRAGAQMGDLIYVDHNGDGNITNEDRYYHGSGLPDFEFGFNLNWEYEAFDLSMNWFGTVGSEILNGNKAFLYGFERHQDLVNLWSPENPTSNIPIFRGRSKDHYNYAGTTDYWLENGDYLRLKQVTLGYSLPKSMIQTIGVNKLRFFLTAQNPITFTNYEGYDPEIGGRNVARRGIDDSRYPLSSLYSLGVKLDF